LPLNAPSLVAVGGTTPENAGSLITAGTDMPTVTSGVSSARDPTAGAWA